MWSRIEYNLDDEYTSLFRFYDSIYTERYMTTPAMNEDGYIQSAVTNMTGFLHAKFLLVHGTGDGKTRC